MKLEALMAGFLEQFEKLKTGSSYQCRSRQFVKELQKLPLGKLPLGNFLYICRDNYKNLKRYECSISIRNISNEGEFR